MMREAILVAQLLAAAGAGLAGGVFFAFSAFVMPGLKRLPVEGGIRAMNVINAAAWRPLMILLFGTAAVCLAVIASLIAMWGSYPIRLAETGATMGLAGAVFYILGAVLVTLERNVPLNRMLSAATDASGPMVWRAYLRDWVKWNHVRTATCAVACALLVSGAAMMQVAWLRPVLRHIDCMTPEGHLGPCY
jgi:uncharacterized membrane protein